MTEEFERRLRAAFDAQARESVSDSATPPPPRFATGDLVPVARRRRARVLAPLAAAAAVVAVVTSVAALQHDSSGGGGGAAGQHTSAAGPVGSSAPTTVSSTAASDTAAPAEAVHIKLLNSDHGTYGVGMPVVALFSVEISDGAALRRATTATVNGTPITGAWYFERSTRYAGYPLEAHWRPESYWPEHAKVHVAIATKGLSAGPRMAFDDALTLDFTTGARTTAVVNDVTHRMTVTSGGKELAVFPVSLGTKQTPTTRGTKVIMDKGLDIAMRGPGYDDPHVKYTQLLTYSGEYLHSAPWNVTNIKTGVDSSNGCTNLVPADVQRLYSMLEVGDLVEYPNASGPTMSMSEGFGDWNVPWKVWQQGGVVPVR